MATRAHVYVPLDAREKARLGRRAQFLAAASVTYNVIEAVIAIAAGVVAGSVALVGFGLDSIVEVSSGLIILWQFRHRMPESREQRALRLMALSFFALAGYVTFESVRALITGHDPDSSPVGIGLAVASLVVMPFLSWAQRQTGRALGSNAVVADSTQTLLCTYLSAVLLVGLVLNATLGRPDRRPGHRRGRRQGGPRGMAGPGLLRSDPQRARPRPKRRLHLRRGELLRRALRPDVSAPTANSDPAHPQRHLTSPARRKVHTCVYSPRVDRRPSFRPVASITRGRDRLAARVEGLAAGHRPATRVRRPGRDGAPRSSRVAARRQCRALGTLHGWTPWRAP